MLEARLGQASLQVDELDQLIDLYQNGDCGATCVGGYPPGINPPGVPVIYPPGVPVNHPPGVVVHPPGVPINYLPGVPVNHPPGIVVHPPLSVGIVAIPPSLE